MELSRKIEALLFYKGEPVTARFLADALGVSEDEARDGLTMLEQNLLGRGVTLMRNGDEYVLGTAPEVGPVIEKLIKEELDKDLGKAGIETLAIVLYRGPIARSEINYIRGVNSNYILRNLLVRGLIEKAEGSSARSTLYRPTFELLSFMGISSVQELPEYDTVLKAVEEFQQGGQEGESNTQDEANNAHTEV